MSGGKASREYCQCETFAILLRRRSLALRKVCLNFKFLIHGH